MTLTHFPVPVVSEFASRLKFGRAQLDMFSTNSPNICSVLNSVECRSPSWHGPPIYLDKSQHPGVQPELSGLQFAQRLRACLFVWKLLKLYGPLCHEYSNSVGGHLKKGKTLSISKSRSKEQKIRPTLPNTFLFYFPFNFPFRLVRAKS